VQGFRKAEWLRAYQAQRDRPSKTRARSDVIVEGLTGVRVPEANIDARPSARKAEYPKPVTEPFDYLLRRCRPKVIIAHGTDAVAHLHGWAATGTLIACKHVIYVGREQTTQILAETRQALGEG
jgi:hypothetical protein